LARVASLDQLSLQESGNEKNVVRHASDTKVLVCMTAMPLVLLGASSDQLNLQESGNNKNVLIKHALRLCVMAS
jgi:hypothetical protein